MKRWRPDRWLEDIKDPILCDIDSDSMTLWGDIFEAGADGMLKAVTKELMQVAEQMVLLVAYLRNQ